MLGNACHEALGSLHDRFRQRVAVPSEPREIRQQRRRARLPRHEFAQGIAERFGIRALRCFRNALERKHRAVAQHAQRHALAFDRALVVRSLEASRAGKRLSAHVEKELTVAGIARRDGLENGAHAPFGEQRSPSSRCAAAAMPRKIHYIDALQQTMPLRVCF